MGEWIRATTLPMEPPIAYGSFHIAFFLCGLLVVVPTAIFLSCRVRERQGDRILFAVGIFLALSEVYKQFFYTFYYGNGGYQWHMFPFQLCSTPMYLCLLLPFVRKNKIRRSINGFLVSFGLMGGFVSYLSPESMCRNTWNMTLHSFLWHMLLIFIGLYAGFRMVRTRELTLRGYVPVAGVYCGLGVIAFGINCLSYDAVGFDGTLTNMFYVGPHNSPLIICRDICARAGWGVNTVVYMLSLITCAFLFYLAFFLLSCVLKKRACEA